MCLKHAQQAGIFPPCSQCDQPIDSHGLSSKHVKARRKHPPCKEECCVCSTASSAHISCQKGHVYCNECLDNLISCCTANLKTRGSSISGIVVETALSALHCYECHASGMFALSSLYSIADEQLVNALMEASGKAATETQLKIMERDLQQKVAADVRADSDPVLRHVKYIQDRVLVDHCPNKVCDRTWFDFEACALLTCPSCHQKYCALCNEGMPTTDSETMHRVVSECQRNPGSSPFIRRDLIQQCIQQRMCERMNEYMNESVDARVYRQVVTAVGALLEGTLLRVGVDGHSFEYGGT
jgi:hypothetical protein